jgi:hypothetical protein
MFRLFKSTSEAKRKDAHERELRRSLKEKLVKYEKRALMGAGEETDFTEVTIDGNAVRVRKENITVHDLTSNTFFVRT